MFRSLSTCPSRRIDHWHMSCARGYWLEASCGICYVPILGPHALFCRCSASKCPASRCPRRNLWTTNRPGWKQSCAHAILKGRGERQRQATETPVQAASLSPALGLRLAWRPCDIVWCEAMCQTAGPFNSSKRNQAKASILEEPVVRPVH